MNHECRVFDFNIERELLDDKRDLNVDINSCSSPINLFLAINQNYQRTPTLDMIIFLVSD